MRLRGVFKVSRFIRLFNLFLLTVMTVGCASIDEEKSRQQYEPGELDLFLCEEPRPQICTREYDPVCAKLQDGSVKTYATGCTSCADSSVVGYTKGACKTVLTGNEN